jgi:hypothetical protein
MLCLLVKHSIGHVICLTYDFLFTDETLSGRHVGVVARYMPLKT